MVDQQLLVTVIKILGGWSQKNERGSLGCENGIKRLSKLFLVWRERQENRKSLIGDWNVTADSP
jgi:hypothetical protein